MSRWRFRLALVMLTVTAVWLAGATCIAALPPVQVEVEARIEPDGTIVVAERRVISAPRPVEFVELLVPESATFSLTLADGKGAFTQTAGTPASRAFKVERTGKVVYVEWRDDAAPNPQVVLLTYRMEGALTLHRDSVEWYWPAVTGSGGRAVSRFDASISLPGPGPAYLYAYGGEAGGVRVGTGRMRVSATDIAEDRTLEWRLLVPAQTLPGITRGEPGGSDLVSLRRAEELRIQAQMETAGQKWFAHWLLAAAPVLLVLLYWFTVRRLPPYPEPAALTDSDLTSVSPAVVGWVYDAAWFDFAVAQLLYLERQGQVKWDWAEGGEQPAGQPDTIRLRRTSGTAPSESDEALLALFHITEEPVEAATLSQWWADRPGAWARQRNQWLKAVEREVPVDWMERPSAWVGGTVVLVYVVAGIFSGGVGEWLGLWAVAILAGLMIWKRRHLSALGESHVARWVRTYYAARIDPGKARRVDLPNVPPEYFLAVEVGDSALERLMGKERYQIVVDLYEHLEFDPTAEEE